LLWQPVAAILGEPVFGDKTGSFFVINQQFLTEVTIMQLNLEQKKLIQLEPSGHCLVKGMAGSGKTTVAIHRIPHLMHCRWIHSG